MEIPRSASVLIAHLYPPLLEHLETQRQRPARLPEVVSLATEAGAQFRRFFEFLWGELARNGHLPHSPLVTAQIENTFAALFVEAAERDVRVSRERSSTFAPSYLARAEEHIRAHLAEPLSVLDVAAAAGVSSRALSRAFRKHRGSAPPASCAHTG